MILNEFIEATARLETYFEKEYTNEQRKIMFEELKDMSIDRYREAINYCIRNNKFMPKIADILKASAEIDNTTYETKREYENCKICNGTGIVRYFKVLQETGYEYDYACRCNCKNANYYSKKIPTFEELGIKPMERLVMNFE